MDRVRLSVCSIFLLILLLPLSALAKKEDAKTLYDKATRLESDIKNSAKQRSNIANWKNAISAFRTVYYKYPSSGYSDNALFHVATLYSQMAEQFEDSLYYHRATATFQFLIDQYSSSSLSDEAMLESIRIYRDELKKDKEADALEKKLKIRNPKAAASISRKKSASPIQPATLKTLRHYTGIDYTRIVIDFDKEVSFKRDRLSAPDRLYFDFDNTVAMKPLLEQNFEVNDGFLKQIRIGQNTFRKARVVLDLKSIETYEVFALYHPYRIVIDIQGTEGGSSAAGGPYDLRPARNCY